MINYIIKLILQIKCNLMKLNQYCMMGAILHFHTTFNQSYEKKIMSSKD